MPISYDVKQGDCISSIAFECGFDPETIWNHPDNAELKKKRKDLNVLLPGDVVVVPDKRPREFSKPTTARHKFRLKNTPAKLRLRLLTLEGKPRANEKYVLEIDGQKTPGVTDGGGRIERSIPPDARTGRLLLKEDTEQYELLLGDLDPIDTVIGQQFRLKNLGFYAGPLDNQTCLELEGAIVEFQLSQQIAPSGKMDDATQAALRKAYGG